MFCKFNVVNRDIMSSNNKPKIKGKSIWRNTMRNKRRCMFRFFFCCSLSDRLILDDHKVCLMGHWCVRNLRILCLLLHSLLVKWRPIDYCWHFLECFYDSTEFDVTGIWIMISLFKVDLSIEHKNWAVLLFLIWLSHFQKLNRVYDSWAP